MSSVTATTARSLAQLTAGVVQVPADIVVTDLTLDSRAATPGALFLACSGRTHHGLKFAPEAVARGARAVLYEDRGAGELPPLPPGTYAAAVPGLSERVGLIADRFFGSPSQQLTVAGITGTNGKTTCAWLLAQALEHCHRPAAYIGTLGFGRPPQVTATPHTTSDAVTVQRQLAQLRALGAECVCMEVSSHALDQARVNGVRFHTAVFTNLTRDHLDYHGTMAAYGAAKARLFAWPDLAHRVINIDDAFGAHPRGRQFRGAAHRHHPPRGRGALRGAVRARGARDSGPERTAHRGAIQLGHGGAGCAPGRGIQRRERADGARGAARLGGAAEGCGARPGQVPRGQRAHGDVRRPWPHAPGDRRLRAHARCPGKRTARRAPALPRGTARACSAAAGTATRASGR